MPCKFYVTALEECVHPTISVVSLAPNARWKTKNGTYIMQSFDFSIGQSNWKQGIVIIKYKNMENAEQAL